MRGLAFAPPPLRKKGDTMNNPFQTGTQNHRLLERLKVGPLTNVEIVRDMAILNSTGRISDLRARGFDVKSEPKKNGIWVYTLRN